MTPERVVILTLGPEKAEAQRAERSGLTSGNYALTSGATTLTPTTIQLPSTAPRCRRRRERPELPSHEHSHGCALWNGEPWRSESVHRNGDARGIILAMDYAQETHGLTGAIGVSLGRPKPPEIRATYNEWDIAENICEPEAGRG